MSGHHSGDECAVYLPEYELMVVGYANPLDAEDVAVGDFIRDPARDRPGVWFEVTDTGFDDEDDDEVHLFLIEANAADVADGWRAACEGHETTRGAIGDTYYCDGSCIRGSVR